MTGNLLWFSDGSAGTVTITGSDVTIDDASQIIASTSGSQQGGEIEVNADVLLLDTGARIVTAATDAGDSGTVTLNIGEWLGILSPEGAGPEAQSAVLSNAVRSTGGDIRVIAINALEMNNGRIVSSVPGCRVLCVYLRGEGQEVYSDAPAVGERFHVELCCIEPKSDAKGIRRSPPRATCWCSCTS